MEANVCAIKDLLAASWEFWDVALTVLGHTIKKRTEDKHVAAGENRGNVFREAPEWIQEIDRGREMSERQSRSNIR